MLGKMFLNVQLNCQTRCEKNSQIAWLWAGNLFVIEQLSVMQWCNFSLMFKCFSHWCLQLCCLLGVCFAFKHSMHWEYKMFWSNDIFKSGKRGNSQCAKMRQCVMVVSWQSACNRAVVSDATMRILLSVICFCTLWIFIVAILAIRHCFNSF